MKKTKIKIRIIVLAILTLLGLFIYPKIARASDNDIIINEIGAYEKSENEWIEIYNKGSEAVDITGWKFYEDQTNHKLSIFQNDFIIDPGEYAIIANVAQNFKNLHPDFNGTILDSSWSSLKESGEEIGLKNSKGDVIELFTYLPCPETSLQRIDQNLNDYTANNWQAHQTKDSAGQVNEFPSQNNNTGDTDNQNSSDQIDQNGSGNGSSDQPDSQDTNSGSQTNPLPHQKIISSGTVVINEFVSDPSDGEVEWIELYNKNVFDIDLSGWKLIDGSGRETVLSGALGSNYDNRFFVIENPRGKLNNSGDAIILKDNKNNQIDVVYYGNWDSGFIEQNAPVAKDPNSIARIFDGAETFNNRADFVVTTTPTKGLPNIITLAEEDKKAKQAADEQSAANEKKTNSEKLIVINEIYPNPPGSDLENEFIELKNTSEQEIDLTNWKISDSSKMKFRITNKDFDSAVIKPNGYFIIERKKSGIALNNDKDTVKLIDSNDKIIQTVKYSEDENVPENVSYVPAENGDWLWTTSPTKGQENIINKLNHAPEINLDCPKSAQLNEEVICDASDSYDLDNDEISFTWQINGQTFSDVLASYKFDKPGTYTITLVVSDGKDQSTEAQKIKITEPLKESEPKTTETKSKAKKTKTNKSQTSPGAIGQETAIEIEPNNESNKILKYLVTTAAFLGLGIATVIKKIKS